MAWTEMDDLSTGDTIDEVIWDDQVKGNLEYLLTARPYPMAYQSADTNYTTTSTSWANVDETNLKLVVTPAGSRVLLLATLWGGADNTDGNYLRVRWNEATAGGTLNRAGVEQNTQRWLLYIYVYTGLTPGTTYTFYLMFGAGVGGATSTIYRYGWPITLIALEV